MPSIQKAVNAEIKMRNKTLNMYRQLKKDLADTIKTLDKRPMIEKETELSLWKNFSDQLVVSIFYKVESIPAMMPVLEFFEEQLGEEFTSYDNEEYGQRIFEISSNSKKLVFNLKVTPDEEAEGVKCRKVVVGETVETYTSRKPKYILVCD